jgi:SnoaL-like domain
MSAADYLRGNRQPREFALFFLRHFRRRVVMSNIESVIENYVASWNETDPARRQSSLAASCAATASYRDPVMVSDGQAGLDAMLAGVQAKFPGFVLRRISKVDSHNNAVRFAWSLGPVSGPSVVEGVDFATLSADGKLANIVGFIDKMPG